MGQLMLICVRLEESAQFRGWRLRFIGPLHLENCHTPTNRSPYCRVVPRNVLCWREEMPDPWKYIADLDEPMITPVCSLHNSPQPSRTSRLYFPCGSICSGRRVSFRIAGFRRGGVGDGRVAEHPRGTYMPVPLTISLISCMVRSFPRASSDSTDKIGRPEGFTSNFKSEAPPNRTSYMRKTHP